MIPILMSASVSTRGMKDAYYSDEERENMYLSALEFYTTKLFKGNNEQKIVFAENSGWNLTKFSKWGG